MEQTVVERWGMFEISLPGKTEENPFADDTIRGQFTGEQENISVPGFYDGNGMYTIRFMPSFTGNTVVPFSARQMLI